MDEQNVVYPYNEKEWNTNWWTLKTFQMKEDKHRRPRII